MYIYPYYVIKIKKTKTIVLYINKIGKGKEDKYILIDNFGVWVLFCFFLLLLLFLLRLSLLLMFFFRRSLLINGTSYLHSLCFVFEWYLFSFFFHIVYAGISRIKQPIEKVRWKKKCCIMHGNALREKIAYIGERKQPFLQNVVIFHLKKNNRCKFTDLIRNCKNMSEWTWTAPQPKIDSCCCAVWWMMLNDGIPTSLDRLIFSFFSTPPSDLPLESNLE